MMRILRPFLKSRTPVYWMMTKPETKIHEKKFEEVIGKDDEILATDPLFQIMLKQRREEIKSFAQQTSVPEGAGIAFAAAALPLIVLTGSLVGCCVSGSFVGYAPLMYMASLKYAAFSLCFSSGLHWGFSLMLHECQNDPIHSSPEAKWHFLLATIPIFFSSFIINELMNSREFNEESTYKQLASLIGLNLYIVGLDVIAVRKQLMPYWLIKLKLPYSLLFALSVGVLMIVPQQYKDLIQQKETIYKQEVLSQEDLLK